MKIKSYAKINLNLKILNEIDGGLHKIESLIIPIDLYDLVEINEIDGEHDIIKFDDESIGTNNTITHSLDLLRKFNNFPQKFEINVQKNIPTEAGLGGGSSNAGAIISILSKKYNISIPTFRDVALKVGSDVPFFVNGRPSIVTGIGDKVNPESIDYELDMILAVPNEVVSTRESFGKFDNLEDNEISIYNFKDIKIFNDFWKASSLIQPELIRKKEYLESVTQDMFFMSGSGSALFCLGVEKDLVKKIDLIDKNEFRLVKLVKKLDFSLETISD